MVRRRGERDVKLVQLKRRLGGGTEVLAAVGPMEDPAAEAYAADLLRLTGQRAGLDLSVDTTPVASATGDAAEPPAAPAELLRAVLSRDDLSG
jgi:hypothetical protein